MKSGERSNEFAILGDDPANIETDCLDFQTFVKPFADRIIRSVSNTPFTIGIFADWGQGKTTIMHILKNQLEEKKCPTVWFDPWKYNNREDVWKGLAYTLVTQIRDNSSLWDEIRRKKNILMRWLAGALISKLIGNTWGRKLVDSVEKEPWSPGMLHDFEATINKLLGLIGNEKDPKENLPLILFVDDLDRCLPDSALAVMEAMKLVLNRKGLIIVMGIAEEELSRAVYAAYVKEFKESLKDEDIDVDWGRKYIRKIIQVPFPVPVITDISLDKYVADCLDKSKVNRSLNSRPEWNEIIREACKGNLRQVKRFINSFISEMDKAAANTDATGSSIEVTRDAPRVVFILLLSWRFREFLEYIRGKAHIKDLLYRYQTYFMTKTDKRKITDLLIEKDEKFHEDLGLDILFTRCFSPDDHGTSPLVRPFSDWQDTFPFLQFGVLSPEESQDASLADEIMTDSHEDDVKGETSKKISDLISLSQSLIGSSRFDQAQKKIGEALLLSEKAQDLSGKAVLLNMLASLHQLQGKYSEALEALEKSYEIFEKLDDLNSKSSALCEMAAILRQTENYEEALDRADKAYELAKENNDTLGMINALGEIALVHKALKNYEEEYKSLAEMLSLSEEQGMDQMTASVYLRLGNNYMRKQDRGGALKSFNRAMDIAKKTGDSQIQSAVHEKMADYHLDLGEIDQALEEQKMAQVLLEELPDREARTKGAWRMGKILREKGDEDQAAGYIDRALKEAGEMNKQVLVGDIKADIGQWNLENKKIEIAIPAFKGAARSYKEAGLIEKSDELLKQASDLGNLK